MHLSAFEDHFGTNACLKSLGVGTRVLMKFLRSAFEGPETHQCRTMGLKSWPQEEMYAWTCWSSAVQKARQDTASEG